MTSAPTIQTATAPADWRPYPHIRRRFRCCRLFPPALARRPPLKFFTRSSGAGAPFTALARQRYFQLVRIYLQYFQRQCSCHPHGLALSKFSWGVSDVQLPDGVAQAAAVPVHQVRPRYSRFSLQLDRPSCSKPVWMGRVHDRPNNACECYRFKWLQRQADIGSRRLAHARL